MTDPTESARTLADLREAYQRIVRLQDARAEAKRQEILARQAAGKLAWERRMAIELYLQLIRRAREEGWMLVRRAA